MSVTIKRCPFCSCLKVDVMYDSFGYYVNCPECLSSSDTFASKERAITEWNNRSELWVDIYIEKPDDMMKMVLVWDHEHHQPRLILGVHIKYNGLRYWQPIPRSPLALSEKQP